MTEYKIDFNAILWESPLPGVRFKRYKSDKKQIRLVEYKKDFIEPDWCPKGHTGYVIEGEFEIDFNGTKTHYKRGDNIFIPAGNEHKHKVRIISNEVKVFLVEDI